MMLNKSLVHVKSISEQCHKNRIHILSRFNLNVLTERLLLAYYYYYISATHLTVSEPTWTVCACRFFFRNCIYKDYMSLFRKYCNIFLFTEKCAIHTFSKRSSVTLVIDLRSTLTGQRSSDATHLQNAFLLALSLFTVYVTRQDGVTVFAHLVHLIPIVLQSGFVVRALPADDLKQTDV